ncbi:NUDIX domain-containing protein [Knoellia sp. p5-6-4]|uniref:NUDIX hydrolase n=1 Tax=unclassified Knoellia TaxID=2618719 RepID=UPI0023DA8E42|nr:NUDIX domain-containing protein [Knoellia sp. p5-6-4]MDF2144744.1 NUDIX domain-containing protein [Knoellia sp. p5-6-4]
MIREFPVAPVLREHADAWQAGGDRGEPATPRPAATVMFVRDGAAGLEVFMLRRAATMAFAPRTMVFPGGGVDPRDADPRLPWAGPTPAEWAERLQTDEATARELVAAAVREVFEECGVLLAGPSPDSVMADVRSPHWHQQRLGLLDRSHSLAEVLIGHGLVLRSDLLSYRAHWITPEFEPRRYDTRFFAAAVPAGQGADDQSTEADTADWVAAAELLEAQRRGEAMMLPPTLVSVEEIAAASSAAAFIAERPPVAPVTPRLTQTPDGPVMRAELPR